MVEYVDSQVPTLAKGDESKFERWYTQFEAFADTRSTGICVYKPHKDLPPEGELTPREDMSTAQKKAYRYHNKELNDLYKAFADNRTAPSSLMSHEQWEAASILPSPDFGVDFHTFRMSQNLNWLPNVSNVAALRLLRQPDPPPSPTKAGAKGSSHNNNSTTPSSSPG
eukprot:jgi/Psemu1/61284/gm1.61284_g